MNVFDYIKNYCEYHNIKRYLLKSRFLTKRDIDETVKMSGGIAFFYKLFAVGEVDYYNNLFKNFLQVETPTDFWDLSNVVMISDNGTLQKVETDFIFVADNQINFKLFEGTDDAMFSNIKNFCAQYFYLIPLPDSDKNDKIKVKVDF